jgi:FlaA1/EpsC-like NDP-sugar epimerase
MNSVDVVLDAAALKIIPACEYNPIEAVMTNVMGARNVIRVALDTGVEKAISTDKGVNHTVASGRLDSVASATGML